MTATRHTAPNLLGYNSNQIPTQRVGIVVHCIKQAFAMSFACFGLLMVFTWAEGSMLLCCQTMLAAGGVAALLRYGNARATGGPAAALGRRRPLRPATGRRPG